MQNITKYQQNKNYYSCTIASVAYVTDLSSCYNGDLDNLLS